ncbi:hypothetical protein GTG28_19330 [Vibrio sp. OCN044]|uniref:Uncharacterized protein n=1 Tax=Vibrio tetraodonis subsp. pristinus TaxID=2695891 RepID=A0A6L8M5S0_9VIBR|nr:hypothetical protein [Vibrio tetraodonis]MYM61372.1 hypothetical protein [Vibrio tetraodonis subsp. pristinus]
MKYRSIITIGALLITSATFVNASTFVYCGRPDGSDWDWLLDTYDNYETIHGQWARVTEVNHRYFNVFRVSEAEFQSKAFRCPAGYIPQPAESGTSRWEVFEIVRQDGSRYLIDGYKTYYSITTNQVTSNHYFRSL